jgi:cation/acetate symporter
MSAASFISMAGLISFLGFDGAIYLMGWTGGYVLLTLLLAPYLRKFGKFTVPDFVGDRYYSGTARAVAAVCAIFVSFTYVAGQMRGVGIVFSRFLQVDIVIGVMMGMAIVAFFAVLGGMKGITWTQVAQYFVLIIAFMIPAIAISLLLTGNPIPQLALTTSDIVPQLNALQTDLGFSEYVEPFRNKSMLDVTAVTIALMVGTAGLPHVIVRFYTVPNVRAARYSGFWALLFIGLLYTTAPAIAVFAKYNLLQELNGVTREQIETSDELAWARSWEETGLLQFEGEGPYSFAAATNAAGEPTNALAADSQIQIDRDIIVLSTPEVAQLSPIVIALVAAGGLAAALSTASGLLLVISSSVSHDIYYRLINPNASEKQRLLFGRGVILVAVILAGLLGIYPPAFVGQVVAFAFGLAASSFFPIILLGIFDKRTNDKGAIAGMIVGIVFTAGYIVGNKYFGMPTWFLGISAEGIGAVGMLMNLIVTYAVSRATDEPPAHIQQLVEDVRVPRGAIAETVAH